MTDRSPDSIGRGLLLAPVVFVAHWLEESSGFVSWFNDHVTPGITADSFWNVNAGALLITLLLLVGFWTTKSTVSLVLVVGWLSFLMLTNAVFHLTGAIVDRGYVPGLWTAIVLYLPYCTWIAGQILRRRLVPPALFALTAVLGAIPMAVHGYRILFLGSRLF